MDKNIGEDFMLSDDEIEICEDILNELNLEFCVPKSVFEKIREGIQNGYIAGIMSDYEYDEEDSDTETSDSNDVLAESAGGSNEVIPGFEPEYCP